MARKRKYQIASLLLCSAYFLLVLRSPHAIRASLIPIKEVSEQEFFSRSPDNLEGIVRFEDPTRLGFFRELLALKEGPTLQKVVEITRWMGELKNAYTIRADEFTSIYVPEYPMDIYYAMVKQRIHTGCHNESILINTMFQANGIKARAVDFMSVDGLGGSGHTMSEVWIPEKKKWIVVDGQQVALFFLKKNNEPLSALELRHLVITQSEKDFYDQVKVFQLPGPNYAAHELWELYRIRSRGFSLLRRADFHTGQESSLVYILAHRIEQGGVLPPSIGSRLGRAFRATFGGGTRWHLVDEHTPRHLTSFWWWLSRAMALWLMLTLISFLPFRRWKKISSEISPE